MQEETPWPARLRAEFRDVEIGIARTQARYGEDPGINEIEQLYIEQILSARRFIYAESQYFASRQIAEAIAERLSRPDPPEIVLINPLTAEGWLEQAAMDTARVRLCHAVRESDPLHRFRIFVPLTSGGIPIYVYRYGNTGPFHMGVMADEIEAVIPDAVIDHVSGFKMVNYAEVR